MIFQTSLGVFGSVKPGFGRVVGEDELQSVLSGVNGGANGVVLVMVVRQSALDRTLVNEVDILAVEIV